MMSRKGTITPPAGNGAANPSRHSKDSTHEKPRSLERLASASRVPALALVSTLLLGCTYAAQAPVKPAYNVYASYQEALPGKYALVVDPGDLSGDFKVRGYSCSAHTYPLEAREAFRTSVAKTFEQLVEEVDVMESPIDRQQMRAGGYAGLIRVIGEEIDADLVVIPGFWSAEMEAEVEMTASLVVDGPDGRLLGTRASANGEERSDAGSACSGGADAMSIAASDAMEDLMTDLGERLSNAPRLRVEQEAMEAGL